MKNLLKLASISLSATLIGGALTVKPVQAAIVGGGTFTYTATPFQGIYAGGLPPEFNIYYFPDPYNPPEYIYDPLYGNVSFSDYESDFIFPSENKRLVTNLDIYILGNQIFADYEDRFWTPPEGNSGGRGSLYQISTGDPRDPGFYSFDQWFFGEVFDSYLFMASDGYFEFVSGVGDYITGQWSIEKISNTTAAITFNSDAPIFVPEPLTFLGVGTTLAFGSFFKRKSSRSALKKAK
ncbi:PEP-CTERM sorting domain-containing protein [Gloeothece verrucosa]|uniref:PEP-CTERM protein-sorting domain-containing protein n=1 Tax=Gloeothece verrucosa (strain PCC 7822) TaxID=497965 RepID=E0U8R8_GLOV7|nr:PEP-CTERM sorting domain-containing protein [Gloeothece verrucosa]ADN14932.1 hypothetical protein Cyan7822_2975 [Gloeothece verrucosa PCC 7822]